MKGSDNNTHCKLWQPNCKLPM